MLASLITNKHHCGMIYMITITPWKSFGPYVLIRVIDPFLQRRLVLLMLPMLDPQVPRIE